ncbi:hypothetical protein OVA29_08105 [Exiguobacterium sp. SL14]|nr:hypothetical protein [Exiguobacterium sp. SL14]MCY1690643.1 hypothetical protein [Exiguobacterium sp. SL14]
MIERIQLENGVRLIVERMPEARALRRAFSFRQGVGQNTSRSMGSVI